VEGARPARPTDAERCAQLCREALESLQVQRGGAMFARREAAQLAKALLRPGGLSRMLSDPRRRVLVGTIDDHVVGLGLGKVDPVGESALGVVDALYVDPGCRSGGVGQALLRSLVDWFGESGCEAVDATALPGDRATKNFLEAAGFKARLITMHKPLG
jgi:GNAT superfamily N-acetyltransferase